MLTLKDTKPDMIANNLVPFAATHPGEVIKDELTARGIPQSHLARQIGVSSSQLNEVLNGKRPLGTRLALLIGAALDLDAEPLLRLQQQYDLFAAQKNDTFMQRLREIRKLAAMF